jgi:4'-phosphopantetheinyl transferase
LADQSPLAATGWSPGPRAPRLAEGAVHVWRADLDRADDQLDGLLCALETERAVRLLSDRDRRRWTRARGVLRALLGLYLDVDPRALRFQVGAHGKPSLEPAAISFNLSHSAGTALYALAPRAALGIDVELAGRRTTDVLALAARMLGPQEASRLQALQPAQREREFLRAWVRHEAELKRLGLGLEGRAGTPPPSPWVGELDVGHDAAAALALGQAPLELQLWSWPPCAARAADA